MNLLISALLVIATVVCTVYLAGGTAVSPLVRALLNLLIGVFLAALIVLVVFTAIEFVAH